MLSGIGGGEWLVLLVVVLIVVGPRNLPKVIRSLGRYYARFQRFAESFKRELFDMEQELTRIENGDNQERKFPE